MNKLNMLQCVSHLQVYEQLESIYYLRKEARLKLEVGIESYLKIEGELGLDYDQNTLHEILIVLINKIWTDSGST